MDIKVLPTTQPKLPVFSDLKSGDVFQGFSTGTVYVKMRQVDTINGGVRNAVRLEDGTSYHFTDGTHIRVPKQSQLRVEE